MSGRRIAALIVFMAFIIWGVIEVFLQHDSADQIMMSFIFGIVAIVIKDQKSDWSFLDLFKRKKNVSSDSES